MNEFPARSHLRLKEYDYAQNGAYFVTVCVEGRAQILGHIVGAGPRPARCELTPFGDIVQNVWNSLPQHTTGITLGPFVIMPDHIHAIILLDDRRAGLGPAPTALTEVVRQLKSFSSRRINQLRGTPGSKFWQRGYYEHVIRNEEDFLSCREYIENNPAKWLENTP